MASVSTYLNFDGKTEQAFEFYKSVFGTEYIGQIFRMGDMPAQEGMPPVPEHLKRLVMNVQLPILGGHILMGTDTVAEWGHALKPGNNVFIVLHPDSRAAADALFAALSDGGTVQMPMADQFWGDYFGDCVDKFGVQWMISYTPQVAG
ncbi:MAG: VOC family protein [Thermomicrobiales bacterium]